MKFVSPKNDVAFKKIFGHEDHLDVLISFLNAVLNLEGERAIQSVALINMDEVPTMGTLKPSQLHIEATDGRDVTFIVEIQMELTKGSQQPFVYYASQAYAKHFQWSSAHFRLSHMLFIGILDFEAFEGTNYITHHQILNPDTREQTLDGMEFVFIELPKFQKGESEVTTILDKWVYFLKNVDQVEEIPDHSSEPPLHTAYDIAYRSGWSSQELALYDSWWERQQD